MEKVLAKIEANSSKDNKSTVVYLTPKEFEKPFYIHNGKHTYCTQRDAIWWSKNGRKGTHWQIGKDMYVMVNKVGEDPYEYYNSYSLRSQLAKKSWAYGPNY